MSKQSPIEAFDANRALLQFGAMQFDPLDVTSELRDLIVERLHANPERYAGVGSYSTVYQYSETGLVVDGDADATGDEVDNGKLVIVQLGQMIASAETEAGRLTGSVTIDDGGKRIERLSLTGWDDGRRHVSSHALACSSKIHNALHELIVNGKWDGPLRSAEDLEIDRLIQVSHQAVRILGHCATNTALTQRYSDPANASQRWLKLHLIGVTDPGSDKSTR